MTATTTATESTSKRSMRKALVGVITAVAPLWKVEDVSAFLQVPVATLYQWRHRRLGPRAFKVGRHLRYDPADVRAWLAAQGAGDAGR